MAKRRAAGPTIKLMAADWSLRGYPTAKRPWSIATKVRKVKEAGANRTLYAVPELGPQGSGYALACFPDIWKDAIRAKDEIRRVWRRALRGFSPARHGQKRRTKANPGGDKEQVVSRKGGGEPRWSSCRSL